jgi:homocysteine S-methyltransferase
MSDLFRPFLKRCRIVVLDGALATELERRGANLNDSLWSAKILLETPELIRAVHLDYLRAGANVMTTASYQATFRGFARIGLSDKQAVQLFRLSVRLASEAREEFLVESSQPHPLIAASVGSYGAFLADGSEYRGDYNLTRDQLKGFHRRRIEALLEASPDLLAFETVPCRKEGEAILELMGEYPEVKAWLSFSCCDEVHVCSGDGFRDCVKLANDSDQILAVGLNCTSPFLVEPLIRSVGDIAGKYFIAYPNSGERWDARNRHWRDAGRTVDFGGLARRWYAAGARVIGGCCRTTPDDIRSISREFNKG